MRKPASRVRQQPREDPHIANYRIGTGGKRQRIAVYYS